MLGMWSWRVGQPDVASEGPVREFDQRFDDPAAYILGITKEIWEDPGVPGIFSLSVILGEAPSAFGFDGLWPSGRGENPGVRCS
jgi:hypothetical protein